MGKKIDVYQAYEGTFLNSKCVFLEYHDIIKSPWFLLLFTIMADKEFTKIFNFKEFDGFSVPKLMQWYVRRKHRNFFMDLKIKGYEDGKAADDEYERLLNNTTYKSKVLFSKSNPLNIVPVMNAGIASGMMGDIVIWNDIESDFIREDIEELFGKKHAKCVFGPFEEAILDIPEDSTIILADITKLRTMVDKEKINYRSVIISNDYGYNYNEKYEHKVDIQEVINNHPCKINFFDNVHRKSRE